MEEFEELLAEIIKRIPCAAPCGYPRSDVAHIGSFGHPYEPPDDYGAKFLLDELKSAGIAVTHWTIERMPEKVPLANLMFARRNPDGFLSVGPWFGISLRACKEAAERHEPLPRGFILIGANGEEIDPATVDWGI